MHDGSSSTRKPVILYLVTEDWYFLLHRLPMAHAAARAGYQVHIATHLNKDRAAIEALGFDLHPLAWRRGSLNPLDIISIVREIRRLYARIKPDVVHHIALQPVVIGSLAALGLPVVALNSLVGLGFVFTSSQPKARAVRAVLKTLLPRLMDRPHRAATVENRDDKALLAAFGVRHAPVFVLPGSGVDIARLTPHPEPDGPFTAAFVGRLLDDKGIRTLVAAHDLLTQRGMQIRLLIAGEPDPANPTSDSREGNRGLETPSGHFGAGPCFGHCGHLAVCPSRRAAIAARGPADQPAGSCCLREAAGRDRRSRLPRDRAARRERTACSCGRSRGTRGGDRPDGRGCSDAKPVWCRESPDCRD